MNKTLKKTLFVIMSFVIMAVLTVSAAAATTIDSGTFGEGFAWTLDSDGKLTVTGEGEMEFDVQGTPAWKEHKDSISSVVISEGITHIPFKAFDGYAGINSVSLPDSLKVIGGNAFCGCENLESIDIPENTEAIYGWAFAAAGLKSITIPDSVTHLGDYVFYGTPLEAVTLSKNIDAIYYNTFAGCDNLKSIVIPDGVKKIYSSAFYRCDLLEEVIIPDSVELIDENTFFFCKNLKELKLPANLKEIGKEAFYASGIKSFELPEGLTTIKEYAFCGTKAQGTLVIPDSVTSIGAYAFSRSEFSYVILGSGLKTIEENVFASAPTLDSVIIPATVKTIKEGGLNGSFYSFDYFHYMGDKENLTVESDADAAKIHYSAKYIDAVSATCSKDGHEAGYFCTECDDYLYDTVTEKATGIHIYENYVSDGNADCFNDGTKTACCEYGCGEKDTVTDAGSKLKHVEEIIPGVAATCTTYGYSSGAKCTLCGTIYKQREVLGLIPHKFENYEIVSDLSCISNGIKVAYCEYGCGNNDRQVIPADPNKHTLSEEWESTGDTHSHRCTVCTELFDGEAHIPNNQWEVGAYHTEEDPDTIIYIKQCHCSECGALAFREEITFEEYKELLGIGKPTPDTPEEPTPDTPEEPTETACDHLCHKTGFMGFLWKIVQLFSKLFKANPVCECGAAHY